MSKGKKKPTVLESRSQKRGFLEHLFGSRTRVKILRLFLRNPGRSFYVREIGREVGTQIHAVRRELDRFVSVKLLRREERGVDSSNAKKKFYIMDEKAPLYPELKSLVINSQIFVERDIVLKLREAGKIGAIFFCGVFVDEPVTESDVLIIGRLDRGKLKSIMDTFGKEVGFDIRYTIMTGAEFKYRREVADRFLLGIIDGKHILGYNSSLEFPLLNLKGVGVAETLKI